MMMKLPVEETKSQSPPSRDENMGIFIQECHELTQRRESTVEPYANIQRFLGKSDCRIHLVVKGHPTNCCTQGFGLT